jgi:ribosome-associated protein
MTWYQATCRAMCFRIISIPVFCKLGTATRVAYEALPGSGRVNKNHAISFTSLSPVTPFGVTIIPASRIVEINRQPIELFKILKFEGLVGTGGEAKLVISDGQVRLNGKVETQKSKKILSGDVIEFQEETLNILLKASDSQVDAQ